MCVCVLGYMFFVGQFIAWSERELSLNCGGKGKLLFFFSFR